MIQHSIFSQILYIKNMKTEEIIQYWIDASNVDFKAMNNLFNSKDYVWSLFLGHLVIEKLIKALAAKNKIQSIPKVHGLNKLARLASLELNDDQRDLFDIFTSFNIEARYPDYKKEFYKKCDFNYTSKYIEELKGIRNWLLELLNK